MLMQHADLPPLQLSILPADTGWFDAGWAVFQGSTTAGIYPPLYDLSAQRAWLGGFEAAWTTGASRDSADPEPCRQAMRWGLVQALGPQPALLGQLLLQGTLDSPAAH